MKNAKRGTDQLSGCFAGSGAWLETLHWPHLLDMLSLLLTALSAPVNVRVMVPGGLDGYWAQKIELFENMKRDEGEEVKVLVDPVDSTIHFESVKAEIDGGTELYDGFVIMASWLPDFVNRGDGGLKVRRRRKSPGSERSMLSDEFLFLV